VTVGSVVEFDGSSAPTFSGVPGREVGVWKVAEEPEEGEVEADPTSFEMERTKELTATELGGAEVRVKVRGR
jgi:hypothetical protein